MTCFRMNILTRVLNQNLGFLAPPCMFFALDDYHDHTVDVSTSSQHVHLNTSYLHCSAPATG